MNHAASRLASRTLGAGLVFGLLLAPAASGQLAPVTLPESLDTATSATTLSPALASNVRQEVFAVWHRATPSGLELMGRGFQAFGDVAGSPTVIALNASPRGYDVAALSTTSFLVVWVGPKSGQEQALFGARFTLGGTRQGGVVEIAPAPTGGAPYRPSVACRPGRGCFVAWSIDGIAPIGTGFTGTVLGRRLDENLNPLGAPFEISQTPPEALTEPKVAMSPGGRVVVAWPRQEAIVNRPPPIPGETEIGTPVLRVFGSDGQAITNEVELETPDFAIDTNGVDVAWNDQNQALVVWDRLGDTGGGAIRAQLVSEVGVPIGTRRGLNRDTTIARGRPAIDWDGGTSRFAVTWGAFRGTGANSRRELTLQLVNAAGERVGFEAPVVQVFGTEVLTPASVAAASEFNTLVAFSDAPNDQPGRARVVRFASSPTQCESPFPLPFPVGPCTLIGQGTQLVLAMALFRGEDGTTAFARPLALTQDTAAYFFRSNDNPELFVKTVDGSALNQRQWFFYGALSNQEYVISLFAGPENTRTYYNPPGNQASVGDTDALSIPPAGAFADELRAAGESEDLELAPRGTCLTNGPTLCVRGGQFRIQVEWRDFQGNRGTGTAEQLTSDSGHFWFFAEQNIELVVKVLDGRPINGHFWLFYASLSNVQFTVRVFDQNGVLQKTYTNPGGTFASVADTGSL